jgi:bud site selection protein 20
MARNSTHQKKRRSIKSQIRARRQWSAERLKPDQVRENLEKGYRPEQDPDLPGEGMHYCTGCDRHFLTEEALNGHKRTKDHKRRIKETREYVHTQKEAEWAVGLR